jgi:large subunit ribosomal protein L29
MKANELKTKTVDELKKSLMDARKSQFNARFKKADNQLSDSSVFRKLRRDIARIKTIIKEKLKAQ